MDFFTKIISSVILFSLLSFNGTIQASELDVTLNGESLSLSQPPVIENGRTLVPLRGIFEALGASVQWNSETRTVLATKGDVIIELPIGSTEPNVNGTIYAIDTPAQLLNGSTMVPLRFVSESLGTEVNWNASTKTVEITETNPVLSNQKLQDEFFMTLYKPNNTEKIKQYLETGADPTDINPSDGASATRIATRHNNLELVKLLLEYGDDVNKAGVDGNTALGIAVSENNLEIAKVLIEHGAKTTIKNEDHTNNMLMKAVRDRNTIMVKLLLENGSNPNIGTHGSTPIEHASSEIYFTNINGSETIIPPSYEIVKLLLKHGADRNIENAVKNAKSADAHYIVTLLTK